VTMFMTLLAGFQVLLHRYSGQQDIAVGTDIANRNRVEVEGVIGFFVNQLVLRVDLSGNPTFREVMGRVREVALGAYANQDLPFERIVEELQPERSKERAPLFQVMFDFQNAPVEPLDMPGLRVVPFEIESKRSKFDLTCFMWEAGEYFAGSIEYSTELFERPTITRMCDDFQTILNDVVADPGKPISSYLLMAESPAERVLDDFMGSLDEVY
jgi:non-ribosomal peptide synthetase component F